MTNRTQTGIDVDGPCPRRLTGARRRKRLSVAVSLAASMWACNGSPTAPSAPPVPPTRPTSTLSGLVFTVTPTGLAPVDGARVRLEIGSFRLDTTTDQNGLYTLSGLYDGISSVLTSKDGYDTDTRQLTISGDTQLDIRVVRRAPFTLSGVVSEVTQAGLTPVEGVFVEDIPQHLWAMTDTNGFYSLSGLYAGSTITFSKAGY